MVLNAANQGRPGNWGRRSSSKPRDKTRKDMAGTSWDCGTCGFCRTECFVCGLSWLPGVSSGSRT
eukprot:6324357-Amphidinium_carterae.1